MYDSTLDNDQIKELADYVAKRKVSSLTQPLQVNEFIEKYMETYTEAFETICKKNKKKKKLSNQNLYKLILFFALISSIILSNKCLVVDNVNSS